MPFAPPEPTNASRALPPTAPARDKRPSGTGFSTLVDDKAPVKAEPKPRAEPAPREVQPEQPTEKVSQSAAKAGAALTGSKPKDPAAPADSPDEPKAKSAESTPASAAASPDAAPSVPPPDPSAIVPDAPAAISTASTPMPAVPVPVAMPVAQVQVAAQTAAPLSIAAAGLAAAKAITTAKSETSDTPTTPVAAQPDAEPEILPGAERATPKAAEKPVTTGFNPPETTLKTETSQQLTPAAPAKSEAKPETVIVDGKAIPPAPADTDKQAVAAPKQGERPAESGPVRNGDFTGAAPALTVPAPAHHAAATAPTPVAQLTAAVATAQPVPLNGLAVELAARATTGATRFEIRLDPAELGRIDVRIDIDKHGQVTSHLTVEKPETLAMLRQDSPQLQRALNDAGFKTGDGAMQFSLGDQSQSQAQQQNADGGQRHAHRLFIQDDDMAAPAVTLRDYGRLAAMRSGVDISV